MISSLTTGVFATRHEHQTPLKSIYEIIKLTTGNDFTRHVT